MISIRKAFGKMAYYGITKKEFSEKSGISYPTLTKMYRQNNFTSKTLDRICEILNVNVGDILEYIPDTPNSLTD